MINRLGQLVSQDGHQYLEVTQEGIMEMIPVKVGKDFHGFPPYVKFEVHGFLLCIFTSRATQYLLLCFIVVLDPRGNRLETP